MFESRIEHLCPNPNRRNSLYLFLSNIKKKHYYVVTWQNSTHHQKSLKKTCTNNSSYACNITHSSNTSSDIHIRRHKGIQITFDQFQYRTIIKLHFFSFGVCSLFSIISIAPEYAYLSKVQFIRSFLLKLSEGNFMHNYITSQ